MARSGSSVQGFEASGCKLSKTACNSTLPGWSAMTGFGFWGLMCRVLY